ncbi:GNAT family N-acetyltransferase [Streptomyces sp. S1]|uniref:GNAT family N-acetyltransferase n=1 Tax=Streptomyces sp. S1 TaxID=718288 RepID=UPI003D7161CF
MTATATEIVYEPIPRWTPFGAPGDWPFPALRPEHGGGIVARAGGVIAGHLRWYCGDHDLHPYEIAQVTVYAEWRRRGIATRLLREAQKIEPAVRHSTIRTLEGDAWAKSTGDEIPVRSWHSMYRARYFEHITEDIKHKILYETERLP